MPGTRKAQKCLRRSEPTTPLPWGVIDSIPDLERHHWNPRTECHVHSAPKFSEIIRIVSCSARLNAIVPVTSTSGFMIASNSKVFRSDDVPARDQGLLPQGLDTTVARLMPGWHEPQPPRGSAGTASRRGLTLRALATHAWPASGDAAAVNESEILTKVGAAKMLFPQFASTAYSNLGVSLLGRTLEKATNGLTWEEWVETRIMEPLGMSRSGPCVRSAEEAAAIVDGVEPAAPRHVVPRPFTNSSRCPWDAPAGGVFSTPQDMARWADFLAGTYPRRTCWIRPPSRGAIRRCSKRTASARSAARWRTPSRTAAGRSTSSAASGYRSATWSSPSRLSVRGSGERATSTATATPSASGRSHRSRRWSACSRRRGAEARVRRRQPISSAVTTARLRCRPHLAAPTGGCGSSTSAGACTHGRCSPGRPAGRVPANGGAAATHRRARARSGRAPTCVTRRASARWPGATWSCSMPSATQRGGCVRLRCPETVWCA